MSDVPQGPGWWQASDGRWYPPAPGTPAPPPGPPSLEKGPPTGPYGPATVPPGPTPPPGFPQGAYPQGGYPPGGYPPPGGAPAKKGNGCLYAVLAIVAVVVVIGTAAFFLVGSSSGDDTADDTTTTGADVAAAEKLVLQSIGDPGPDPFSSSFAADGLPALSGAAADAAAGVRGQLTAELSGALVASGSDPGLYGGSRDNQVCDALAIADFLEGDVAKATAFAGVLGISAGSVRDYLVGLTPVILASDTWVTNHGFVDGEADPFQAVLEAGTAVLVDGLGVPRVRCSCGNPLTVPQRDGRSTEATEGDEWDGYAADQVTVVEAGEELSTITLLDAETGEEFSRAIGAGQTGDVQISLQWTGDADLDLRVFDPDEFEIYFADRISPSGGELDVDIIPSCGSAEELHTENVFWADGTAPAGGYRVVIDNYDDCDDPTEEYDIQVVVGGEVIVSETATVPADGESEPYTFDV